MLTCSGENRFLLELGRAGQRIGAGQYGGKDLVLQASKHIHTSE